MTADRPALLSALDATMQRVAAALEQRKQPTSWDDLPITLSLSDMCAATGMRERNMRELWHSKSFPGIPQRDFAMELKADKEQFRKWWIDYNKEGI